VENARQQARPILRQDGEDQRLIPALLARQDLDDARKCGEAGLVPALLVGVVEEDRALTAS